MNTYSLYPSSSYTNKYLSRAYARSSKYDYVYMPSSSTLTMPTNRHENYRTRTTSYNNSSPTKSTSSRLTSPGTSGSYASSYNHYTTSSSSRTTAQLRPLSRTPPDQLHGHKGYHPGYRESVIHKGPLKASHNTHMTKDFSASPSTMGTGSVTSHHRRSTLSGTSSKFETLSLHDTTAHDRLHNNERKPTDDYAAGPSRRRINNAVYSDSNFSTITPSLPSISSSPTGLNSNTSSKTSMVTMKPADSNSRTDVASTSHRHSISDRSNSHVNGLGYGSSSRISSDSSYTSQGLVGLKNLGNTCFMNSVLQCLSNTKLLLDYCLNDEHLADINNTTSSMKGSLVRAYAKLMKSMWRSSSDNSVSPTEFKAQIQRFAPRFVGYSQQDSQEFLLYLLEGIHEDLNRVRKKQKSIIDSGNDEETISASGKAKEMWKRYLDRENSKLVDLFVGQLRSALTCMTCGYVSNTFDPIWNLPLPIRKTSEEMKLIECFSMFTQEDILEGDEKPVCARCKQRRKCTKKFSIQRFPKILILYLKRFDQGSYFRSKLSTLVNFPIDQLDLSQFSAENGCSPAVYNLYAVSNHCGTPFSGHYTAYCRHPESGKWHYYNDGRVSSISASRLKSSEAYVLFYELTTPSKL